MKNNPLTDFEQKALDQFISGQNLFGKDGAFAPLLKSFIEQRCQLI